MRITKIETQRKAPGRKSIFADGRFLAGVSAETLLRLGLRTGDEIGPDVVRTLQQMEELVSARNVALRFLSYRPRSEHEVRDKLREKEFGDAEIARTLDELRANGLVNDRDFARIFIRNSLTVRPAGRLLLSRKLLALGVPRSIVEEAMQDTLSAEDQRSTAVAAAEQLLKRAKRTARKEDPRKLRQRIASALLRRGYGWDIVEAVLKRVLDNANTDHEISEPTGL
jgi:regulatory protein